MVIHQQQHLRTVLDFVGDEATRVSKFKLQVASFVFVAVTTAFVLRPIKIIHYRAALESGRGDISLGRSHMFIYGKSHKTEAFVVISGRQKSSIHCNLVKLVLN